MLGVPVTKVKFYFKTQYIFTERNEASGYIFMLLQFCGSSLSCTV